MLFFFLFQLPKFFSHTKTRKKKYFNKLVWFAKKFAEIVTLLMNLESKKSFEIFKYTYKSFPSFGYSSFGVADALAKFRPFISRQPNDSKKIKQTKIASNNKMLFSFYLHI